MAAPPIEPPRQSWSALIKLARESQPAIEPDVRAAVRRAITRGSSEAPATGIFTDLLELTRNGWLRGALASLAAITLLLGWETATSSSEALMAMDLQGAFSAF